MTTLNTTTELNFANHIGYSDVDPFEIIRRVSNTTIEIRAMNAEKDETVKTTFVAGGFSAFSDNAQAWHISSNEANPIIRIRLQKNKTWKNAYGQSFSLSTTPSKYYDYNF